jgi:hypothetical protein
LKPTCRTFVDGPTEVYAFDAWDDYFTMSEGEERALQLLDRYRVDILVLSSQDQRRLVSRATGSDAWRETYRDHQATVFVRRTPIPR